MATTASNFSRISIIGLGYIGLPTAALFATKGSQVIGVDICEQIVETINAGQIHIVEPDLDGIVYRAVANGRLRATTVPEPADAFIVAVPTPLDQNSEPELSYVQSAAEMIAPHLEPGNLVILESSSPVGTTRKLAEWLADARKDLRFPQDVGEDADIQIAYCPERVLPGNVIRELVENDRIIGGMTEKATTLACDLYHLVVRGNCVPTNAETAEMCKLVENSSRDVQIAFANELSIICDRFGIDVWHLIDLANRHPRVNILRPGAGVGGHCIAVDPWFIVSSSPEDAKLIRTAREVNDNKPAWVVEKVKIAIAEILSENPSWSMSDVTVACLGLAFKPDIDDLRESPALEITAALSQLGCTVLAVEPNIFELPALLTKCGVKLCSLKEVQDRSQLLCALVKHSSFGRIKAHAKPSYRMIDVVGL